MLESDGISLGDLGGHLGLGSLCIGIVLGVSFISFSHQSIEVIPIREKPASAYVRRPCSSVFFACIGLFLGFFFFFFLFDFLYDSFASASGVFMTPSVHFSVGLSGGAMVF